MRRAIIKYNDDELIDLMRGSKRNSELAFSEVYRRYSGMIHAYCACMINDRSQIEDIFQEVLIRFYQKVADTDAKINTKGFLFTIARNLCLNYIRDKKFTVPIEKFEIQLDTYQPTENDELVELIAMAISLLDNDYKEIFILREIEGLSYEDIAEIANISVANARKRAFRARMKVKDILTPYFKDQYTT